MANSCNPIAHSRGKPFSGLVLPGRTQPVVLAHCARPSGGGRAPPYKALPSTIGQAIS